jgi:hypothetical protein
LPREESKAEVGSFKATIDAISEAEAVEALPDPVSIAWQIEDLMKGSA